ncbi:2-dehydro-3-deoxygalactonokinase [Niabella beijingensis]|uniref:2-dehydro-3-deoxygalactonokinase n=1 Tax=Niabella beijingensis TaxID=2872700 RepID=UPI001CC00CC0|nr:2-dehydro-3-deoxygalactonokinase [Niabella beijingensis]MBZ4188703.1 2-dehydro-3-deoxygalactonokinase [Niabella beijingensis]
MDTFLSCDWGTSTFRLRLVRISDLAVLATVRHQQGIAQAFTAWEQAGSGISRMEYYTGFLKQQIHLLQQQSGYPLNGLPVVLSGMASSSIGFLELPYKELPFAVDGTDLIVRSIPDDHHPLRIVSGACSATDVMRGEETKIVGVAGILPETDQELLLLLPGTHSKHLRICNRQVISFQTFMTGEFFALLSRNSVLAGSVATGADFTDTVNRDYFIKAVQQSRSISVLRHAFRVRTSQLLHNVSPEQNYYYLSGLLIGEELRALPPGVPVYLLGGAAHLPLYLQACETLGLPSVALMDADEALIAGQQRLLLNHPG